MYPVLFFEAPATRKIAVVLPGEALEANEKGKNMVGILKMSLYGTRDAAANFQREVWRLMVKLGFTQSKYNSRLYHRGSGEDGSASGATIKPQRETWKAPREKGSMSVLIHGDDFVAVGYRRDVYEFRKAIAGRFTVKDKVIGTDLEAGEIIRFIF